MKNLLLTIVIRMRANKAFDAPLGATVNVNNGRIE